MWFIPGIVPACGLLATAAGGTTIGRPGIAAGAGNAAVGAAAGLVCEWRLELKDTKVAQPSTRAIAAPAARPTLSRRV